VYASGVDSTEKNYSIQKTIKTITNEKGKTGIP
jgi:hypothetical protein